MTPAACELYVLNNHVKELPLRKLSIREHYVLSRTEMFFLRPKRKEIANPFTCNLITNMAMNYDKAR